MEEPLARNPNKWTDEEAARKGLFTFKIFSFYVGILFLFHSMVLLIFYCEHNQWKIIGHLKKTLEQAQDIVVAGIMVTIEAIRKHKKTFCQLCIGFFFGLIGLILYFIIDASTFKFSIVLKQENHFIVFNEFGEECQRFYLTHTFLRRTFKSDKPEMSIRYFIAYSHEHDIIVLQSANGQHFWILPENKELSFEGTSPGHHEGVTPHIMNRTHIWLLGGSEWITHQESGMLVLPKNNILTRLLSIE